MPGPATAPIDDVPDVRMRGPRAATILWVVTFLAAVVLFSRLRTLPDLFLVAAFAAWCAWPRLRRAAVVPFVTLVFVCLEMFLPFDVSTIDAPGGMKVARVVIGKPGPEALEAARRGEIILTGCLLRGIEPRRVLVW